MQIIYKNQTNTHKNSDKCVAIEYPLNDKDISGAIIELKGRYPNKGRVVNEKCKELAYIIKGSGLINIENKEFEIQQGDLILINPNEKYYWDGNLTMFMPSAPAWYPEQHKEIKD